MGLIMLILIGAAPTAYALNRTMPDSSTPAFVARHKAEAVFAAHAAGARAGHRRPGPRGRRRRPARPRRSNQPAVYGALAVLSGDIQPGQTYGSIKPRAGRGDAQPAQRHVPVRRRHSAC
jgi:PiT family inorganic phosphate transporter